MNGTTIILLVITAVAAVFGLAFPPLCFVALITGILGALAASSNNRAKKKAEEDARTAAIIAAVQQGQKPPGT